MWSPVCLNHNQRDPYMRHVVPFASFPCTLRLRFTAKLAVLLMLLQTASAATTRIWSGGGTDSFWANGANWSGGVAPISGDPLVFPTGAARLVNSNNIFGLRPGLITVGAAGYDLAGNSVTNDAGILATNSSGTVLWEM